MTQRRKVKDVYEIITGEDLNEQVEYEEELPLGTDS